MMIGSTSKISVIVPIYNSEKHLRKCIKSILDQTYNEFELLLINDGSIDGSGKICDLFVEKDSRVRVFHKKNGGVSSARNLGIDKATGEYICFIDSDDWVEPEYLETFFSHSIDNNNTIVIQDLLYETENSFRKYYDLKDGFINSQEMSLAITQFNILSYPSPYCKLYSSHIIKSNLLRFDTKINLAEDLIFYLDYLKYVDSIRLIGKAYYHYTTDNQISLSRKYYSHESEYNIFSEIKINLGKLADKYNLNVNTILSQQTYLGSHLMRSINSLYRPQHKKKRSERLSLLKKIATTNNINILKEYRTEDSLWIKKIGIKLYCRKAITQFDFIWSFLFTFRYQFDFFWNIYRKSILKKGKN